MTTIEDYCEIQEGDRRPLKKIGEKTGIKKQTTSGWFRYQHFPRWETFEVFLGFFIDPAHRRYLDALWKQAWPAEQRARDTASNQTGADTITITPGRDTPRRTDAVTRRLRGLGRRTLGAIAAAVTVAVLTAVVNAGLSWWHRRSDSQAAARHCARVAVASSPVFLNVGDPKPHKHKYKEDQVQLVDLPVVTSSDGVYAAVALPAPGESPTGHGWMPQQDLIPATCKGLRP
jgi:hypothetical protein